MPVLIVLGGLPAAGKTTLATAVAQATGTPYLRVDRIEQAIVDYTSLDHPIGPAGYAVAHALAREQLDHGLDVIVECVNPLALTRDAWVGTARSSGADILEVEVVCSDPVEHRHRAETRTTDVTGLAKPTWAEIRDRDYEPWNRAHLVVDTAALSPTAAVELVVVQLRGSRTTRA